MIAEPYFCAMYIEGFKRASEAKMSLFTLIIEQPVFEHVRFLHCRQRATLKGSGM